MKTTRYALIALALVAATAGDRDRSGASAVSATLRVSDVSTVSLSGSTAGFASQVVVVSGSELGGQLVLAAPLDFPAIALAFGQTMTITATDPPSGELDASTGMLTLPVALEVTDAEGDAAPVAMTLTTATVTRLDRSDVAVSVTGIPRDPATGTVKLVGLERIPVGYDNGGEDSLLSVEIVATLEFDPATGKLGFGVL